MLACFAAFVTAVPAAALVTYEFTAFSSGAAQNYRGGWTYTAADYITGPLRIEPFALDSCFVEADGDTPSCGRQRFVPNQVVGALDGSTISTDAILFGVISPIESGLFPYYFAAGAFTTPGTYESIVLGPEQRGLLVVTGPSPVPDAPTWALLIIGFGLTGAALRRRSARQLGSRAIA